MRRKPVRHVPLRIFLECPDLIAGTAERYSAGQPDPNASRKNSEYLNKGLSVSKSSFVPFHKVGLLPELDAFFFRSKESIGGLHVKRIVKRINVDHGTVRSIPRRRVRIDQ